MSLNNIFFKLTDLKKQNNMSHLDFENIEKKFQETLKSPTTKISSANLKSSKNFLYFGDFKVS